MGIMIREYLGDRNISNDSTARIKDSGLSVRESLSSRASSALAVDIEGIHAGPTRNFTRYTPQALKSSIKSWTYPYPKPVILHHNETDGDIIGRVNQVEYIEQNTLSGTPALLFNASIPDEDGANQVRDKRLLTTSIGIIAHDVRCSCCGYEIVDEREGCPEHARGEIYDGEPCYWDIYDMEAKEISYVVVPSDPFARNVKVYDYKKEPVKIAESLQKGEKKKGGSIPMEEKIQELEAAIATLNEEIEKSAIELQEAKTSLETVSTEKETLSVELQEAKEKAEKATLELTEKVTALETEVQLREAAESTILELQESTKEELVKTYAGLRKTAGKAELSEAVIKTRSIDSIKNSIEDLHLELSESIKKPVPTVVTDPTITNSNEQIVKKEKVTSNINLEESLLDIFSASAGRFQ